MIFLAKEKQKQNRAAKQFRAIECTFLAWIQEKQPIPIDQIPLTQMDKYIRACINSHIIFIDLQKLMPHNMHIMWHYENYNLINTKFLVTLFRLN